MKTYHADVWEDADPINTHTIEVSEPDHPTTTCWYCGEDYRDRDMQPRACGEGECCPKCVLEHPEDFEE